MCESGRWSDPEPVVGDAVAAGGIARFPSLAILGDQGYVVGNDIAFFDERVVRERPLIVWELGGKSIKPPDGQFTFAFPLAIADARGRLHVLWAEPATTPQRIEARNWPPFPLSTIWTAAYDPKRGWSSANRLVDGVGVNWGLNFVVADASAKSDGTLGIGVTTRNRTLLYLTYHDDQWTVVPAGPPASAGQISVAMDKQRVYLAYTSADRSVASDANSVFLRRSDDGGRTWSDGWLVSRSGEFPAYQPIVLTGSGGSLHLVWIQTVPGDGAVLRHVASTDGGTNWSAPDDLIPPAGFRNLRAVVDECETVHVVYDDWHGGGADGHVDHAVWTGRWMAPTHLFPSYTAMTPDLGIGVDGEPILVFVGRSVRALPNTHFSTLYSRLER